MPTVTQSHATPKRRSRNDLFRILIVDTEPGSGLTDQSATELIATSYPERFPGGVVVRVVGATRNARDATVVEASSRDSAEIDLRLVVDSASSERRRDAADSSPPTTFAIDELSDLLEQIAAIGESLAPPSVGADGVAVFFDRLVSRAGSLRESGQLRSGEGATSPAQAAPASLEAQTARLASVVRRLAVEGMRPSARRARWSRLHRRKNSLT